MQERPRNGRVDTRGDATYFLKVAIKTSNLLILAICTNYLVFIKYIFGLSDWIWLLDAFSNYLSMYLSFGFAEKYYNCIFAPCNDVCFSCCSRLCYCCCLSKEIKQEINIQRLQPNDKDVSNKRESVCSNSRDITLDIDSTTTSTTTQ